MWIVEPICLKKRLWNIFKDKSVSDSKKNLKIKFSTANSRTAGMYYQKRLPHSQY